VGLPVPVPPTELAQQAGFVRRLALHLLRDDASADDASQETLARALARPPRRGPRLGAWLAAVLRNVVRRDARERARRQRREAVAARPETVSGPEAALSRDEVLSRVAAAVSRLDATHREAVLLRHFEGLPPREIAARLGVGVEAVQARLKRAHARLRDLLDARRGGNVEGWRTALAALVGLEAARSSSIQGGAGVGLAGVALGKVGVGLFVAVAIGCAVVVVLSPSEEPGPDAVAPASPPRGAPVEAARLEGRGPPAPAAGVSPRSGDPSRATASPAPGGEAGEVPAKQVHAVTATLSAKDVVEGVLLGLPEPPEWVVGLVPNPAHPAAELAGDPRWPERTRPSRDGTFRFERVPIGAFLVRVHGPGAVVRESGLLVPQVEGGNHRQAFVFGGATVHGAVHDRSGRPAQGLHVFLRADAWTDVGSAWAIRATTEADGAYRIEGLHSGSYHVVVVLGRDATGADDARTDRLVLAPGATVRLDLGAPAPERTWSGRARFQSGSPLRPPSVLVLMETTRGRPVLHVAVDESGRFSHRVPPGTYSVHAWHKRNEGPPLPGGGWSREARLGEADLEEDLTIPGVVVSGVVLDAATRRPLQRPRGVVVVRIFPGGSEDPGEKAQRVPVEEDGTFRIEAVPAGRWRLVADGESAGDTPTTVEVTHHRDVTDVRLELASE
jgi:RNA polymerase sigma-70 factor (ECF subfamily)